MTAVATKYISLEEYFEFEYKAELRHEYWNGKIRPMSYTSPNHGKIVQNLSRIFGNYFFDTAGQIWTETRMVYTPGCNKVFYPDAVIVLGEPEYFNHRGKMLATLNPTVLIETGSVSTEEVDKNEKWECYQSISSLQQYLLISQQSAFVSLYERQSADSEKWIYTGHSNLEETVKIAGCEIALKDIYHKVEFPQQDQKET
jgi:Uma2 family endonuclease